MPSISDFKPGKVGHTLKSNSLLSNMQIVNAQVDASAGKSEAPNITSSQESLQQELISSTNNVDMGPTADVIEGYREYLKDFNLGDAEIFGALDSILTTGDVFWSFQIFDRIDVVLHTRPNWVNELLVDAIEEKNPKMYARFASLVGMYNLAGSLCQYGDVKFEITTQEEFFKVYNFINSLSYVLQNRLIRQMAIFDRLVAVATSDWALANFTQPQSDK